MYFWNSIGFQLNLEPNQIRLELFNAAKAAKGFPQRVSGLDPLAAFK
jgi:hypothetical protein